MAYLLKDSSLKDYGWHEWICHTNFSFRYGASHPHELVTTAQNFGYRGLAVSDFDGVYGLARSWRALKSLCQSTEVQNPFKIFYGAEVHLEKDHLLPLLLQNTLVLIATSKEGYFNLCKIISYAHREDKNNACISLNDLLTMPHKDLIAIQPMRGLVFHNQNLWQKNTATLFEHFSKHGQGYYFALSRFLNAAEDQCITPTMKQASFLRAPCVLSQDVFFHNRNQKPLSDVLHAIRHKSTVHDTVSQHFVNAEHCLKSLVELEALYQPFPGYKTHLKTSRGLADICSFDLKELRYHYPKEWLPVGFSAQEYLLKLTWESARKRYPNGVPDHVAATLNKELTLIETLEFADYFLTVWDIVTWARSQNILCQGRGSAANSAVCYVLGITSIDPNEFDVLFERFISVERGDPPDIDVDFEHERREEVIQYIYTRYGRQKAAMVANVITFQTRGALRAVGKALGFGESLLSDASELLMSREFRRKGAVGTIQELQTTTQESSGAPSAFSLDLWATLAERLDGFPNHLGIHSGGFILSDQTLDHLVPVEPATMEGRTVIQWSKEDIEALGFFKIDVLALGMLTALRKSFALIKELHGETLTLASIPQGDAKTYDMICRADTVGTFQIESRAQMSMLPRLKPRNFYDLVIEVAIIRPGPIQGGMIHPYLRRRDSKERIHIPDPRLVPILKRTLGIPIFQEQVMRVAMAVGGFTAGESDELRRNIGSFSMKGDVDKWIGKLSAGMKKNNLPDSFIESMIGQLKGFSSYGFPESHAASFALIAYVSSYLKCHYPALFFIGLLNSQPMGFYSTHIILQTAKHLGIKVLPACVLSSEWDFLPELSSAGIAIRMGLRLVRGLSKKSAIKLCKQRSQEAHKSLLKFLQENSYLTRVDLTALAAANALSVFGVSRRSAIWLAEAAPFSSFLEDTDLMMSFADESTQEVLHADFYHTGTSLGEHPASIFKNEEWHYDVLVSKLVTAAMVSSFKNKARISIFGMVIVRQSPPTAKGMVFLTLEDETGLLNLVFIPQVYQLYKHLINRHSFICATGVLQKQGDAISIKIEMVHSPKINEAEIIDISCHLAEEVTTSVKVREDLALASSRNYY